MKSEDQRFEQVKNKIAESEKPARGVKEGDVEATIGGMKKELSDLLNESDAPQQKKASGTLKIVSLPGRDSADYHSWNQTHRPVVNSFSLTENYQQKPGDTDWFCFKSVFPLTHHHRLLKNVYRRISYAQNPFSCNSFS